MDVNALISGFRDRTIFVLGDVMVDKFVYGKVSRVSPEAPVPVVDVVLESSVLGGAANVANVLGLCGAHVFLSGVAGDDDSGRELRDKLGKNRIEHKGVVVDRSRPTTLKTRIVAHNQQVVRVDRESKDEISRDDVERIVKYFSGVAGKVDGVVISDYCKGTLTSDVVERIVSIAKRNRKLVVVNSKADNILYYRNADVMIVDLDEASKASGIKAINETSVRNMGNKILSMLDCNSVVITRGKIGFSVFGKDGSASLVKAPDLGGVYEFKKIEDTALSYLALALFSGFNVLDAARFSCYVVEVLASKTGVPKVTLEDVKEALSVNPLV